MVLKDVIANLKMMPRDKTIHDGFGPPHSYRGYYEQIAFEPVVITTAGEMLKHAESALGATFRGYRGGEYKMHEYSICNIAEFGCSSGDDMITSYHFKYWNSNE